MKKFAMACLVAVILTVGVVSTASASQLPVIPPSAMRMQPMSQLPIIPPSAMSQKPIILPAEQTPIWVE